MSISIGEVRERAKRIFCEKCFRRYLTRIEPLLREFRYRPLGDWGEIENHITWMTRKLKGVYKQKHPGDPILLDMGSEKRLELYSDFIDVKAFREVREMGFMKKARYLREQGILKSSSIKLLVRLGDIRNKLHRPDYEFTESELRHFFEARVIFTSLGWKVLFATDQHLLHQTINNIEKQAEKLLSQIR